MSRSNGFGIYCFHFYRCFFWCCLRAVWRVPHCVDLGLCPERRFSLSIILRVCCLRKVDRPGFRSQRRRHWSRLHKSLRVVGSCSWRRKGRGAYIQQAFTTDTALLQRAIENITPTHAPRNLRPVFDAVTRYTDSPQDQVFFISDTFENLPDLPLTLHKIPVGADAENIGIVLFSVDLVRDQYEILVGIQNFTQTSSEFKVQLAVENAPLDDRTISIPSETTQSVLFSGDPRGLAGKVISVHLGIADDFSLDNSVSAILPGVSPLKILLVSDNQKSLLPELLRAYGSHVDLDVVLPTDYHGTGDADIAVFDGSTPAGRETFGGAFETVPRMRVSSLSIRAAICRSFRFPRLPV